VLAYELVHAAFPDQAVAVSVDIDAVRRARSLAVEEDAEGNRLVRPRGQHEVRVPGVEPVGDASGGLIECDMLAADRPLAGEGPLVEAKEVGELEEARLVRTPSMSCSIENSGVGTPITINRRRGRRATRHGRTAPDAAS
jgi:hypothetical protein